MTSNFSSGPTNKWSEFYKYRPNSSVLGRSHRSNLCMNRIQELIQLIREIMLVPDDFRIGLTPGSATGAFECALWNFLSYKMPVNIISFDIFGELWRHNVVNELKIPNISEITSRFGEIPNLSNINTDNDTVFVSTATTSSTSINDLSWIKTNRKGLVLCDAAADAFARIYEWNKIDILTSSFQKVLGCEANTGIIICSPNALKRLEINSPTWAIPRILRLKNNTKINYDFFNGATINTISMICIDEYVNAIKNIKKKGGLNHVIHHCKQNQTIIENFIKKSKYFNFLCKEKDHRSIVNTCITLKENNSWENIEIISDYCEKNNIGYDIKGHTKGFPCIRIWHGYTIDTKSLENLLLNLENITKKCLY